MPPSASSQEYWCLLKIARCHKLKTSSNGGDVIPPCSQDREMKKDNILNIGKIFIGFS